MEDLSSEELLQHNIKAIESIVSCDGSLRSTMVSKIRDTLIKQSSSVYTLTAGFEILGKEV